MKAKIEYGTRKPDKKLLDKKSKSVKTKIEYGTRKPNIQPLDKMSRSKETGVLHVL
ncbi:MAG: hypothetical protein HDT30_04045 [Clostridiales bacterium]|nr:hypothetical protein [Clostridiales bacterium]